MLISRKYPRFLVSFSMRWSKSPNHSKAVCSREIQKKYTYDMKLEKTHPSYQRYLPQLHFASENRVLKMIRDGFQNRSKWRDSYTGATQKCHFIVENVFTCWSKGTIHSQKGWPIWCFVFLNLNGISNIGRSDKVIKGPGPGSYTLQYWGPSW